MVARVGERSVEVCQNLGWSMPGALRQDRRVRLRIDLSYDGTSFHGWARQPRLRTVQGELESALATVLRVDSVETTCAGRTDAGVHARGQVVHVDVAEPMGLSELARRLNGVLDPDVRVRAVSAAAPAFDARFGALWRRYVYRLSDVVPDPLTRGYVVRWPRPLDVEAMNQAAGLLVGEHDFAAFCKKRDGATTVRTLLELQVARVDGVIEATVRADAFCHSMVRALMGCLVAVGEGRRTPEWAGSVLAAQVRDSGVVVMPAHGLTLEEVRYPAGAELAAQVERARVVRVLPGV